MSSVAAPMSTVWLGSFSTVTQMKPVVEEFIPLLAKLFHISSIQRIFSCFSYLVSPSPSSWLDLTGLDWIILTLSHIWSWPFGNIVEGVGDRTSKRQTRDSLRKGDWLKRRKIEAFHFSILTSFGSSNNSQYSAITANTRPQLQRFIRSWWQSDFLSSLSHLIWFQLASWEGRKRRPLFRPVKEKAKRPHS